MTTTPQKQEILRCLSSLDAVQSEKVLNYIKGLQYAEPNARYHQWLKRKALREIGQALQQISPSF